jgi:hypothetical protein
MWISPNHPDPPQTASAPIDTSRRLATFSRGNGAELRVSLAWYENRPYVSQRVWTRGDDGQFWPSKGKGATIRVHEIATMIAALKQVEDLIAAEEGGEGAPRQDGEPVRGFSGGSGVRYERDDEARPRYVERRRRPQARTLDPGNIAAPRTGGKAFDEFDQD